MLEKKINTAKYFIEKNIDFFQCPICGSSFAIKNYSVVCENNHTYDISKKGYINLFNGQTKITKTYDKPLFAARKTVSDCGLYNILCENIVQIINKINKGAGMILDAGCGGGNVTFDIFKNLACKSFFALDLSKDGIDFAAANFFGSKNYDNHDNEKNLLWIVGNLNNLPFKDKKFDVVLNILSPANHSEFKRVLNRGGKIVKVLLESDYLKELRRFIYRENDHNEYSNKDVLDNIEQNMNITDILDVYYTHTVSGAAVSAIFDMTPLTSNIASIDKTRNQIRGEFLEQYKNRNFDVTLAFKIITGTYE